MAFRGYYNRYLKGKPLLEVLAKDASHGIHKTLGSLRGNSFRMLCYPHFPSTGATIFRVARALGIEITNRPKGNFDLAIYWEYATRRKEWDVLETYQNLKVLNLKSRDISKIHLDEMHFKAFGYRAGIDPENYIGLAVRKSNINAVHDGQIVECPNQPDEDFFYMKLIDSRVSEFEVMDMRLPIIGDKIPHLYRAYRSVNHRFVNVPPRVEVDFDVEKWLTTEEVTKLLKLAKLMGMDYCEFDTLRNADGRLYVVDANNTPQGPPKNLSRLEKKASMLSLVSTFKTKFILSQSED